ncbi:TetR family transcriptional regulator [Nostoc sp. 3335mG]|nr:TetR family transcriptional regulator [Nostoc sp. 3335mG]
MESTTAEKILSSARKLVIAGGYNGFSYADIADAVGIRKASIHHHFPSKVDLVRVLMINYRGELKAGLEQMEAQSSDPLDQLQTYIAYWEGCIADGSMSFCVGALLASELPALPSEIAAEVRAHFRLLSNWLEDVIERGAAGGQFVLTHPARVEAEMMMAAIHGAMLSARAYGTPESFAAIVRPMLNRLSAG